jgi:hypothetical protein
VIDYDPRHDPTGEGLKILEELNLPATRRVNTPSGGFHLYFRCEDTTLNFKGKLGHDSLDLKRRGYVMAPPSLHPNGGAYVWADPTAHTEDAPPTLLAAAQAAEAPPRQAAGPEATISDPTIIRRLRAYIDAMPMSIEGQNGSRDCWMVARKLGAEFRHGRLTYDDALALLEEYSDSSCEPSWPLDKLIHKLDDAIRVGRGEPLEDRQVDDEWTTPEPLPEETRSVPAFDPNILPDAFRDYALDAAEVMQAPVEFVAVGLMVAAAGTIGRSVLVRPRAQGNWEIAPVVWGLTVGGPATSKSPAMKAALGPVYAIAERNYRRHQAEMVNYIKRMNEQGKKKGEPQPEPPPAEHVLVVADTTIEKLCVDHATNPRGLLQVRDEVAGWLAAMDKPSRTEDRSFYLTAADGDKPWLQRRLSRQTVHIPRLVVSVLGGIQPGVLAERLGGGLRGAGGDNDGLLQRFSLLVQPDISPTWELIDRPPNEVASRRVFAVFDRLDSFGMQVDLENGKAPYLRFSPEAQEMHDEWITGLMNHVRDPKSDLSDAMRTHLAKFPALAPKLALICELVDATNAFPKSISATSMTRALSWCFFLEEHAARVYGAASGDRAPAAHTLLRRLSAGELGSVFTARDIRRRCWTGLTTPDAIEGVLRTLIEFGWIRRRQRPSSSRGGQPTFEYVCHPSLVDEQEAA